METAIQRLIVAVDGGGSTSRACVSDLSGKVIGRAVGKPANITTDYENSRQNILNTISQAYRAAGLLADRSSNDYAYLGLAGASIGDAAQRLEDSLVFRRVKVVTDRVTTIQGALGKGDGTVALFGTGSFFASRKHGVTRNVGGWGFQLGDDGGGAQLGLNLLRCTIQAHDGLIGHSPLTQKILDRHGRSASGLVRFAQTATPRDYGRFAPELIEAFQNGDSVAIGLIKGATNRLHQTLDALEARSCGPLYLLGGLGPFYQNQLKPDYLQLCNDPLGDGLAGGIYLAQEEFVGGSR